MAASARTALSDAIFSHVQSQGSIAQGKDALNNLRTRGKAIFDDSLAAQLANLGATLDTKAGELGESISKGLGIPAIIKEINDALTDPGGPAAARVLAKAQQAALMTPAGMAGKLIWEGAQLFYKVANWLGQKLGFGTQPDPSAASGAVSQVEAQNQRDAQMRGQELNRIMSLESARDQLKSRIRNAPTRGDFNKEAKKKLEEQLRRVEADLEEARQNAAGLKAYLEQRKLDQEKKAKEDEGKYPADFIGPLPPGAERRAEATTPEVQTMLAAIDTAPAKFNEAFGTLPTKGGEGGTNFSTNAMTSINGGAPAAGGLFGDAAVARIRAGVANIQIAANVTVKGQEAGPDTGPRTAVG
jgi:hypothetical protein